MGGFGRIPRPRRSLRESSSSCCRVDVSGWLVCVVQVHDGVGVGRSA
jgi:hypothetical protein